MVCVSHCDSDSRVVTPDTVIDYLPACRTLGTPTDDMWPGVSDLPDYKPCFPKWRPGDQLQESVPQLDATGHSLLQVRI